MATNKDKPKTQRGKQNRLPGVPGGIPELEEIGYEYAAIRDKRIELNKQEAELKKRGLIAMHKHNKERYKFGALELWIEAGDEEFKAKVTNPKAKDKGNMDGSDAGEAGETKE